MALTEFQRAMNERYNPRSFQSRKNLFPTDEEKAQQQALDRERHMELHASLRVVIQQQKSTEEFEEGDITVPSKSKKKGKIGQRNKLTKKRR